MFQSREIRDEGSDKKHQEASDALQAVFQSREFGMRVPTVVVLSCWWKRICKDLFPTPAGFRLELLFVPWSLTPEIDATLVAPICYDLPHPSTCLFNLRRLFPGWGAVVDFPDCQRTASSNFSDVILTS